MRRTVHSAVAAVIAVLTLLPGAAFANVADSFREGGSGGGGGQEGDRGQVGGRGGGGSGGTVTLPAAPALLSSAAGGALTTQFTMSWSAVSDPAGILAYNWEVSTGPTFSTVIRQNSTSGQTAVTVSGLADGTYFWRVQAVNGDFAQGAWSAVRSFTAIGANSGEPATLTVNPTRFDAQFHRMKSSSAWSPTIRSGGTAASKAN